MSEEKVEKKRFRRTKIAIERDVLQAVGSLIEELGFSNVTLTGVARGRRLSLRFFIAAITILRNCLTNTPKNTIIGWLAWLKVFPKI